MITAFALGISIVGSAQNLDMLKLKKFEQQLDDVMELIDTSLLKSKLNQTESEYKANSNEINTVRLGIIYHEIALNLTFLSKTSYKGFAQKSYDVLNKLSTNNNTCAELMPFVSSYKASALALVSAETRSLKLLSQSFFLFKNAVKDYAAFSYLPQFFRGSVAENLPWFMFSKTKFAKLDMQAIIDKQHKNSEYANNKIMSFVFYAWANQHQSKKHRKQTLDFLEKAIMLDPNYMGGRKKAEDLKSKLIL